MRRWKQIVLSSLETAFSQQRKHQATEDAGLQTSLYEQIGCLQMELQFLKKNLDLNLMSKRQAIEADHPSISIERQCELLGLARSSYYYQGAPEPECRWEIMNLIDEHYCLHPAEGARKVSLVLKSHGYDVGRHGTQRLMQEMGIEPIYPKPNTSVPNKAHAIYPYLLRDMEITAPNQVWAADITYCRLHQGFAYLVAVIDWHSRYVIEWELSSTMDTTFCLSALRRALEKGRCDIFNTDQGSQFTSAAWINALSKHHIDISMDGKAVIWIIFLLKDFGVL